MADAAIPSMDASEPAPDTNGAPTDQDVHMKEEPFPESTIPSSLQPPNTTTTTFTTAPAATQSTTPTSTTPARPSPAPTNIPLPPKEPNAHGAPTRIYLNQKVTPYLLEGMKYLAVYEPEKPLKWLAEFLEGKSKEVEGGEGG